MLQGHKDQISDELIQWNFNGEINFEEVTFMTKDIKHKQRAPFSCTATYHLYLDLSLLGFGGEVKKIEEAF